MRKTFIALSLIMILGLGGALFAQKGHKHGDGPAKGEGMGPGMGPGFLSDHFLEEIGVNESTRKQIREIIHGLKKDMMDGHHQIQEKRIALKKEFLKPELDEAKIKALFNEIAEMAKQEHLKADFKRLEISKLLSPEQRKKVIDHMEQKRKEFFGKMRGPMME